MSIFLFISSSYHSVRLNVDKNNSPGKEAQEITNRGWLPPGIASLVAQLVKNPPENAGDASSIPGSGRSPGEGISSPLQYSWTSLVAQLVKNPPSILEGLIPGLGRSPGGGHGNPLQYSCLENPHGQRGAWRLPSMRSKRVGHN